MKRDCPVWTAANARPASPALFFEGRWWTWAQAHQAVSAVAESLTRLSVQAGDTVAVRTWNCPQLVWLFFATARLGARLVPLNARLADAELAPLLDRVSARVLFGDLPGAQPFFSTEEASQTATFSLDDEAVAAGLFTSGTTGVAKLVELTHAQFFASAAANAARLGREPTQRWLCTLPLFHIGGLAMLYRCAVYGASIVLQAHFDAARASVALDEGVTHVSLVPTMLERILDARGDRPFNGLKAALIGGGPMTTTTLRRARALGLPVLQTYGLTEACSQVTTELAEEADGTTAGPPMPGIAVRIAHPDVQGIGEIEVAGLTLARGLGPWFNTHDVGSIDERGRLKVLARRVDLILSGGENVYPAEIEAVLKEHPQVRDVAIVGRPDETWGQIPVALFVADCEAAEIEAWARERMAAFKVPRAWVAVETLPRNATGKLDRAALFAQLNSMVA